MPREREKRQNVYQRSTDLKKKQQKTELKIDTTQQAHKNGNTPKNTLKDRSEKLEQTSVLSSAKTPWWDPTDGEKLRCLI